MTKANGNGSRITLKEKLNEPILNPKQMMALLLAIIYNVIADLLPLLMGSDVNMQYILINMGISLGLYGFMALMRAAGSEVVPNLTMANNLKLMFKRLIGELISKSTDADEQIKTIKRIGETIADWDSFQDEYKKDFIEFIKETIKDILENINNIQ